MTGRPWRLDLHPLVLDDVARIGRHVGEVSGDPAAGRRRVAEADALLGAFADGPLLGAPLDGALEGFRHRQGGRDGRLTAIYAVDEAALTVRVLLVEGLQPGVEAGEQPVDAARGAGEHRLDAGDQRFGGRNATSPTAASSHAQDDQRRGEAGDPAAREEGRDRVGVGGQTSSSTSTAFGAHRQGCAARVADALPREHGARRDRLREARA